MLRVLIVASHFGTRTLSYYWDWFESLRDYEGFQVDVLNTLQKRLLPFAVARARKRSYDLIVYPYGFYYANEDAWSRVLLQCLAKARGVKVYFLENEYRFLNRKLAYALLLGADYVTTQLPKDIADRAYSAFIPPKRIIALPHGLNERFAAQAESSFGRLERTLDLNLTGDPYAVYLGHQDRARMAAFFTENAPRYQLKIRLQASPSSRVEREDWWRQLFTSKGVLHHEAGSDFLETNDATRLRIMAYLAAKPEASFEEIYDLFFRSYPERLSGRALAPRHLEAIGAHTCQIMFRGRYNDVLAPDVHYIALERDFSNADDVVRRFKDETYRAELTLRAYEHIMAGHRIDQRIAKLLEAVDVAG